MEKEYVNYAVKSNIFKLNYTEPEMLGETFFVAADRVLNEYDIKLNLTLFLHDFMNSETRQIMETGFGCLSFNTGIFVIDSFIVVELKKNLEKYIFKEEDLDIKNMYALKWIGNAYSRVRIETNYTSRYIMTRLPLEHMYKYYLAGHEMGYGKSIPWLVDIVEGREHGHHEY